MMEAAPIWPAMAFDQMFFSFFCVAGMVATAVEAFEGSFDEAFVKDSWKHTNDGSTTNEARIAVVVDAPSQVTHVKHDIRWLTEGHHRRGGKNVTKQTFCGDEKILGLAFRRVTSSAWTALESVFYNAER